MCSALSVFGGGYTFSDDSDMNKNKCLYAYFLALSYQRETEVA